MSDNPLPPNALGRPKDLAKRQSILHAAKSLFFSMVACWRNLKAFTVYVMTWMGIFLASGMVSMLAASLLGDPGMMMAVFMPLALMVAAMFFTSMLFSVRDCFTPHTDILARSSPPAVRGQGLKHFSGDDHARRAHGGG